MHCTAQLSYWLITHSKSCVVTSQSDVFARLQLLLYLSSTCGCAQHVKLWKACDVPSSRGVDK
jgi:hypothetical protein